MKRREIYGIVFLFLILTIGFVSALNVSDMVRQGAGLINEVVDALKPLLQPLLGDISGVGSFNTEDIFFAKLAMLILLIGLVFVIVSRIQMINDSKWAKWTVVLVIPLLAVRFISPEMVLFAIFPTSAFGVAITAILPLVLYFFFVENATTSRTLRKILWVVAASVFVGLYFVRFSDIGSLAWTYLVAAAICILLLIFDRMIQSYMIKISRERVGAKNNSELEREYRRRIVQAAKDLQENIITQTEHDEIVNDLKRKMSTLMRYT